MLFFAGAVAGVRLHALAGVWRDGGTLGDGVWFAARDATGVVEALSIFGFLAFAASFFVFGVVIARSTPLPRGLGVLALGSAIVTSLGVGGLIVTDADAFWVVSMLGLFAVLVSFVVTGGWLLLRGTRPPAGPATS